MGMTVSDAFRSGEAIGEKYGQHKVADEMRVILCALITAHKRKDTMAFWSTVEIAKTVLGKYAIFNEEDWALFRNDRLRKDVRNAPVPPAPHVP
jgi:hypothetical protein